MEDVYAYKKPKIDDIKYVIDKCIELEWSFNIYFDESENTWEITISSVADCEDFFTGKKLPFDSAIERVKRHIKKFEKRIYKESISKNGKP